MMDKPKINSDEFVNIVCTAARKTRYDNDRDTAEEYVGLWRITSPTGESCMLGLAIWVFPADERCHKLPSVISRISYYGFHDNVLTFLGEGNEPILAFHPENFERLHGGDQNNWTLERVDANPYARP
jgi:hypothetical protein